MAENSFVGRFPGAARGVAALLAVAMVTVAVLTALTRDFRVTFDGVLLLVIVVVGVVGYVVARRNPTNPIGWMLLASSALFALYAIGVLYTVLDFRQHGGRLPLGRVGLAMLPTWSLGVVLLGLAVAVFPEGKVGSGPWRVAVGIYVAAGVWFAVVWSISQAALHLGSGFQVDQVGNYRGTQHGFPGATAAIAWSAAPVVVVLFAAFVIRQWVTWRRATGERRKQLTWLMSGGAVSIVSIVVVVNTNVSSHLRVINDVVGLGLTAIPLAIGIGILRYRLYEIDRLISRTLSYAIVTGTLLLLFASIVFVASDVLPFSSPVAVAASTLVAASLFNPWRRRVQHIVDRRFNRARYDAEETIAAFSARLRDAVDPGTVSADLAATVDRALSPAHVTLWVNDPHYPEALAITPSRTS